jgi:Fe-S-cluster-containing dehydrogenase component/DMSO reductase anchor subunit
MTSEVLTTVTVRRDEESVPERRRLPLLHKLLEEQQALSAVERFTQLHEDVKSPLMGSSYKALLPAKPPGPGQQYAFEVDLDQCTGCKACVAACHSLNGLEEGETWRAVGLLHGGTAQAPVQKTVTTACHHCLDPACMKGCPVDAYEKDPVTGIVRHLDDQCIGCQYCTLTCPYEVPQYSAKLGIVRKCDMCTGRLAVGEAPACVQGCPNDAIAIRVVDTSRVLEDAQADQFLPTAPSPTLTLPTTTYKTKQALPRNMVPADYHAVRPAARHMPLVVMLVLTQLAVGAMTVEVLAEIVFGQSWLSYAESMRAWIALGVAHLALGAATLHVGRPQYMFRALLGIRRSWMSREIAAFGVFAGAASTYAISGVSKSAIEMVEGYVPTVAAALRALTPLTSQLAVASAVAGLFAVFSSVMLYHVTGRQLWHAGRTSMRFFGTTLVLGIAAQWWSAVWAVSAGAAPLSAVQQSCAALAIAVGCKLAFELSVFFHLRDRRQTELRRTATLLSTLLWNVQRARVVLAVLGGGIFPFASLQALRGYEEGLASYGASFTYAALGTLALIGGELLERTTFFSACSAPRMPGGVE